MLRYKKATKGQEGRSVPRRIIRFVPAVGLNMGQVQQLRIQCGLGQSLNPKQT